MASGGFGTRARRSSSTFSGGSMQIEVKCEIRPGVFSSEWLVFVLSTKGEVELFVDKTLVNAETEPQNGERTRGHVQAWMIEPDEKAPLVQLPVQAETRVRIPKEEILAA